MKVFGKKRRFLLQLDIGCIIYMSYAMLVISSFNPSMIYLLYGNSAMSSTPRIFPDLWLVSVMMVAMFYEDSDVT